MNSNVFDLYAPDFPHGSPAGYEQGCRSSAVCSNLGSTEWLTCREANIARPKSMALMRQDKTTPIARDSTSLAQTFTRAKPTPTSHRDTFTEPIATSDIQDATPEVTERPETATEDPQPDTIVPATDIATEGLPTGFVVFPSSSRGRAATRDLNDPAFPHGTNAGYQRGCRGAEDCPGNAAGLTCKRANRLYSQASQRARRHGTAVVDELARLSAEEVTEPVKRNSGDVPGPSAETKTPAEDVTEPTASDPVNGSSSAGPDSPAGEEQNVLEALESAPMSPDAAAEGRGEDITPADDQDTPAGVDIRFAQAMYISDSERAGVPFPGAGAAHPRTLDAAYPALQPGGPADLAGVHAIYEEVHGEPMPDPRLDRTLEEPNDHALLRESLLRESLLREELRSAKDELALAEQAARQLNADTARSIAENVELSHQIADLKSTNASLAKQLHELTRAIQDREALVEMSPGAASTLKAELAGMKLLDPRLRPAAELIGAADLVTVRVAPDSTVTISIASR